MPSFIHSYSTYIILFIYHTFVANVIYHPVYLIAAKPDYISLLKGLKQTHPARLHLAATATATAPIPYNPTTPAHPCCPRPHCTTAVEHL